MVQSLNSRALLVLSTHQGGEANLEHVGLGGGFQRNRCRWMMPVAAGRLQAGFLWDCLFAEAIMQLLVAVLVPRSLWRYYWRACAAW